MPKRQDYPEKKAALVSELIAALRLTYLTEDRPKVSCVGFLRVTFWCLIVIKPVSEILRLNFYDHKMSFC